MSSITTWMKLEPYSRTPDMSTGLQARVHDPLWMLARQWQTGEFQGEDNGSPAAAEWRGECAPLSRYVAGPLPTSAAREGRVFDPKSLPLETLVEYEKVRPVDATDPAKLRFALASGQHFQRMLARQRTSIRYDQLFKQRFVFLPLTAAQRAALDADSLRFIDLVGPRAIDGRRLYAALRLALRPLPPDTGALPEDLPIDESDVAEIEKAARSWLAWYDSLITEPAEAERSWASERLEYGFAVAARLSSGEKVLNAREYYSGRLNWYDFELNPGATLQAINDPLTIPIVRTSMPAPVSYRGMPAPRFWQFEDARVDFGAIDCAPEDLAKMLLIEFALTYGNDWFVIPIDLAVGTICTTHALIITNTFGERFRVRSSAQSGLESSAFRMFELSSLAPTGQGGNGNAAAGASLFLMPPTLATTCESPAIEEVLFLRDEMANLAWGVERVVESSCERPFKRAEEQRDAAPAQVDQFDETLTYQLATRVPPHWIPLLPVQSESGLRLRRGKVLTADGVQPVIAKGQILNPPGAAEADGLAFFEEEICCVAIPMRRSVAGWMRRRVGRSVPRSAR